MAALAVLMAVLVVAGCGEESTGGEQAASGGSKTPEAPKVTKVRVGFLPAIDLAYLFQAQDGGHFAKENLEVELQPMAGGAAITPALVGGSLDIGISDPLSILVARSRDLDVKFFAFHRFDTPAAPDIYIVAKDEKITGAKDLEGKTLTSNVLNNQVQVVAEEWLKASGVDPKKVKFVEIGFPNVNEAVDGGTVAAASTLDPFHTLGLDKGLRLIGKPYDVVRAAADGGALPVGGLTTTGKFAEANPDVLKRFRRAVEAAFKDMADPAVQRGIFEKHLKVSPEIAAKINPIDYDNELYGQDPVPEMLEVWKRLAAERKVIPADFDLAQAIVAP